MLPAGWTERPATAADLSDVAALVIATDVAEFGAPDWSEDDQADDWANPRLDLTTGSLLVHDQAGCLAGYAVVWARSPVDVDSDTFVRPGVTEPGVEEHLMAFTERQARAMVGESAGDARIVAVTHSLNTARAERFRAAGFTPVRQFFRMTVDLPADVLDSSPPEERVVVRPAVADDAPVVHRVLTEAFHGHFRSVSQSFEEWIARHPRRESDVAPWLLAEVDGVAVGALVANASVPGLGWVQSVGVLPAARGLGVGLALLARAFDDFTATGAQTVSLGVDAENGTGARRLYEKAGMRVERSFDFYEKRLGPA